MCRKNIYTIFDIFEVEDDDSATRYSNVDKSDQVVLSSHQKKDAKERAKSRLVEIEKQLIIARSNYLQLGGRVEDTIDEQLKSEQAKLKEQERYVDFDNEQTLFN